MKYTILPMLAGFVIAWAWMHFSTLVMHEPTPYQQGYFEGFNEALKMYAEPNPKRCNYVRISES